MIIKDYQSLKKALLSKGYKWFDNNKPYNLNIIGIRTSYNVSDRFNDFICVAYRNEYMIEKVLIMEATTIAGKYYFVDKLFNPQGTAIIVPNQYQGVYQFGLHHGQEALIQVGEFEIWRDKDRDLLAEKVSIRKERGNFLDIHRAIKGFRSWFVGRGSAGCQVVADDEKMERFIVLIKKSIELYGNSFTYTLLEDLK